MKSVQNFSTKVKFFDSEKNQTFSKKCEIYDQFNVEKLEIFQKFSDKYFHQGVDDFLSNIRFPHGENFMAIFTTLIVLIWFSTGTLVIFAIIVYVFTMRVVIYVILSMAIIPTLSTSILFCNLCFILLWISPHSVVKIATWI